MKGHRFFLYTNVLAIHKSYKPFFTHVLVKALSEPLDMVELKMSSAAAKFKEIWL